ncbi:MAG: NAD(P)H-dependent oxidoreductase [Bacteroidota bacterium]
MNNLIIIGHPNKESFCYNGIAKTIRETLEKHFETVYFIDLYEENKGYEFHPDKIREYKELIQLTDRIYFISPVWWFRCTPMLESFFDQVFTPGFAYKFKPITKKYGIPVPLLKNKKVRTYLTHGAPALPVLTMYFNSVKLRLVMGVYSFIFGWFRTRTRQFWSVPFVSLKERLRFLEKVKKDVKFDINRQL